MRTKSWTAALTTTALATVAVLVSVGAATPADAVEDTQYTSELRLVTSSTATDRLEYDGDLSSTSNTLLTQSLSAPSGCILSIGALTPTTTGVTALSTFGSTPTGTGPKASFVGWKSDSLGVGTKSDTSTGQDCAEIVSSETLTWTVPAGLTSALGPATPIRARLDVEMKQNAVATATLIGLDGIAGQTWTLFSGNNAKAVPGDREANCKPAASSGPNSGAADNCDWSITPTSSVTTNDVTVVTPIKFKAIRFAVTNGGKLSIEGGGDYGSTLEADHRSVITLVTDPQGELDCLEGVSGGTTFTTNGDLTAAYFNRGDNGNGVTGTDCVNLFYNLTVTASSAELLKNDASDPSAQFWPVFERTYSAGTLMSTILDIKVAWQSSDTPYVVPMCSGTAFTGAGWGVTSSTSPASWAYTASGPNRPAVNYVTLSATGSGYDASTLSGTQNACMFARSVQIQTNGTILVRDFGYFTGDIKFTTR